MRANVGPGKTVAVVGIGGLGHLGIQWAKALGAKTYALTHSKDKVDDAKKLGADEVILTSEDGWADKHKLKFDFILNCSNATHKFDIPAYLGTLKVGGEFHLVGIPNEPLPEMKAFALVGNAAKISGSHLGNHQEMEAMLQLAADKNIRPLIETIPISPEGIKEAVQRVEESKVRYRFTLTDFDKAFGN